MCSASLSRGADEILLIVRDAERMRVRVVEVMCEVSGGKSVGAAVLVPALGEVFVAASCFSARFAVASVKAA